jgi:hypothetical protein
LAIPQIHLPAAKYHPSLRRLFAFVNRGTFGVVQSLSTPDRLSPMTIPAILLFHGDPFRCAEVTPGLSHGCIFIPKSSQRSLVVRILALPGRLISGMGSAPSKLTPFWTDPMISHFLLSLKNIYLFGMSDSFIFTMV